MKILIAGETSSSLNKIILFLNVHDLKYELINREDLTEEILLTLLSLSEDGFDSLLNKRSKEYKELNTNFDELCFSDAMELLIDNPSLIKSNIIFTDKKMVIGYKEEELSTFLSRKVKDREFMKIFHEVNLTDWEPVESEEEINIW